MDLAYLSIAETRTLLTTRQVSAVDLARAALDRIQRLDQRLGAYLRVTADLALLQAQRADARLAAGNAGPLTGIPLAIKDILSTASVPTTCGSRMLEHYVPQYNATVVSRLLEAGAVFLGKTNMDEFAMGSSNENSAFWPVRNPWDESRSPPVWPAWHWEPIPAGRSGNRRPSLGPWDSSQRTAGSLASA